MKSGGLAEFAVAVEGCLAVISWFSAGVITAVARFVQFKRSARSWGELHWSRLPNGGTSRFLRSWFVRCSRLVGRFSDPRVVSATVNDISRGTVL